VQPRTQASLRPNVFNADAIAAEIIKRCTLASWSMSWRSAGEELRRTARENSG
jgi:hypothetical protein